MNLSNRIAAISLLWLASCATPLQEGPKVRVAIGGQTQLVYLPTTLAARLGYYKDEGIDVELTDFQGGAKSLEALMGGSADVVSGYFDHTIQMADRGKRLKAFAAMLRYPGLALVARGNVASIAALKGRTAGVSSPGSSTHLFLNHLLRGAGLTPDDVAAVGIGMSAGAVAAMEGGKVDAAVMAEPAISQLTARGAAVKVLADARTRDGVRAIYGVESYPAAVLYSTEAWIAANPELARRLARAMTRTLAWIQSNGSVAIAEKMPPEFHGGDARMYAAAIEASRDMYSPDGVLPAEGAAAVVRAMGSKADPGSLYTNEFVSPAR